MENNGITITNDTTLGTLVTFFPDITRRLNDLHIDYCCHGNITIGEAVKEHRLSGDFLKELIPLASIDNTVSSRKER